MKLVCFLWLLSVLLASIARAATITETDYESRPQFKITTQSATWYYDKSGGGFSRLIDAEGKDWIAFHKDPLKENPASAAAGFRGIPNLVYGKDNPDAGAGHPGFDQCVSTQISSNQIRTVTKSGKWAWSWRFADHQAELTIEQADPAHAYWFLYEGPVGGKWSPGTHYWGTDKGGPRHDTPDNQRQHFDQWQWAYFGDPASPRVLLAVQADKDELSDTLWYMGSTTNRLKSADGMIVFGFGRAAGSKPLLRGPGKRFAIGLVEVKNRDDKSHREVANKANEWLTSMTPAAK